jgi:hypothetical protein
LQTVQENDGSTGPQCVTPLDEFALRRPRVLIEAGLAAIAKGALPGVLFAAGDFLKFIESETTVAIGASARRLGRVLLSSAFPGLSTALSAPFMRFGRSFRLHFLVVGHKLALGLEHLVAKTAPYTADDL